MRATPRREPRIATHAVVGLSLAALLASLSLVAWRQSRAFESHAALDDVRRERSVAESERSELLRRIQYLESRGRVVPEARDRLGMHTPAASEIALLQRDRS